MTPSHVPAPAVSDVLRVAEHYGWPEISLGEITIAAGESAWREALESMSDRDRLTIWEEKPWPDEDDEDEQI